MHEISRRFFQAVSNKRFVNRRFSQLNDEGCCHVRERSPSKCCNLPAIEKHCILWGGKSADNRAVTSGWRALTDVPTSLVIQLRKPPVNKPLVRHSLIYGCCRFKCLHKYRCTAGKCTGPSLKRPILVHLGPPTVPWPRLTSGTLTHFWDRTITRLARVPGLSAGLSFCPVCFAQTTGK